MRALGDLAHESFILGRPASVSERAYIVVSLAQLGRFRAAAQCEDEMVQFAETTHAYGIGWAHLFACDFRLVEGDWAKAHLRIEHAIAMIRTGKRRSDPRPRDQFRRLGTGTTRRSERSVAPTAGR